MPSHRPRMPSLTVRLPKRIKAKLSYLSENLRRNGVHLSPAQIVRAILSNHFHYKNQEALRKATKNIGGITGFYQRIADVRPTRSGHRSSSTYFVTLDIFGTEQEEIEIMPKELDFVGDSVPRFPETSIFDSQIDDDEDYEEEEEDDEDYLDEDEDEDTVDFLDDEDEDEEDEDED